MDKEERDQFIAEKLNEGYSLGEVQKMLADEYGENLTYMELRLIAADLDVDWETQNANRSVETPSEEAAAKEKSQDEQQSGASGRTQVTVHKVVKPGAVKSGTVQFASGAKAEWYVDNYGRLGLDPEEGSSKPTEEDIKEFQEELQRQLTGV